jgi:hypothetical protein
MFEKAGLCGKADHVHMTCQMPKGAKLENVDEDVTFNFTYNVKKKRITIRNMEIHDLHPIYLIGEQIFTEKSPNLYNFWDEHLVLHSHLSDPEYCVVATVREEDGNEQVVGFCFGTTIEKPRSSWNAKRRRKIPTSSGWTLSPSGGTPLLVRAGRLVRYRLCGATSQRLFGIWNHGCLPDCSRIEYK